MSTSPQPTASRWILLGFLTLLNVVSFVDRQISGPMQSWVHTHSFTQKADGVELQDQIVLEHKPGLPGLLTRLMFDGLPLRILFLYRHFRTRLGTRI